MTAITPLCVVRVLAAVLLAMVVCPVALVTEVALADYMVVCPVARGTEVALADYTNALRTIPVPLYTYGHCLFQCITPPGWEAQVDVGRDAVVVYKCVSNTAFMVVTIAPAGIASVFLEEWRVPALKKELTSGRPFTLDASAFSSIDSTTNWLAWGTLAPPRRDGGPAETRAEYHSYHIRFGYQYHLCLIAPAAEAKLHLQAFDLLRASFRSREYTGD